MAKNRYSQPVQETTAAQTAQMDTTQTENQVESTVNVDEQNQTTAGSEEQQIEKLPEPPVVVVDEQQQSPVVTASPINQTTETAQAPAPIVSDVPAAVATSPVAHMPSTKVAGDPIVVPKDLEGHVELDLNKYLAHFNATAPATTKAWARNVITDCVKFKYGNPIDSKGCLDCTMFALNTMSQSVAVADEVQMRMRFILACFKYIPNVFDISLLGRGANQLTPLQFKQYMALSNMFHYWATCGSGAEIAKRFNISKELSNCFNPDFAQRAINVIGS